MRSGVRRLQVRLNPPIAFMPWMTLRIPFKMVALGGLFVIAAGCGVAQEPVASPDSQPASTTIPDPEVVEPADSVLRPDHATAETVAGGLLVQPAHGRRVRHGWTVAACDGSGPFLCVEHSGEPIGSVSTAIYPIADFDFLEVGGDAETNLRALANDYIRAFIDDRAAGCGSDYVVEPVTPASFVLAGTPGLSFGFDGTMQDGRPSEMNVQYAAVVEKHIVAVVVSAHADDGGPGRPSSRCSRRCFTHLPSHPSTELDDPMRPVAVQSQWRAVCTCPD